MIDPSRFSRNIALFGAAGQELISAARVAVIGLGGLGSHAVQQLIHLGVEQLVLADPDIVTASSLNRVVGTTPADVDSHEAKTAVAQRLAQQIQPACSVDAFTSDFRDLHAKSAIARCSSVISCLDDDAARLDLTELCCRMGIPFFDVATDTGEPDDGLWYGGRVLFSGLGDRCPACMDLLDQQALVRATMTPEQVAVDAAIYGVSRDDLGSTGPSVVSLNGVLASLAVMEWMVWTTELRDPSALLEYRGVAGAVFVNRDAPRAGCYYCGLWPRRQERSA